MADRPMTDQITEYDRGDYYLSYKCFYVAGGYL
jgi:hypothetical protein